MDSLRYWADVVGVDGFRFDLAVTLGRGTQGFTPDHPLLVEHDGVAYLSWLTREEGYRLLPLARAHAAAMGE